MDFCSFPKYFISLGSMMIIYGTFLYGHFHNYGLFASSIFPNPVQSFQLVELVCFMPESIHFML